MDSIRPRVSSFSSTFRGDDVSRCRNRRRWSYVGISQQPENTLSSCADSISTVVDSAMTSISDLFGNAKDAAEKTVNDLYSYLTEQKDKQTKRDELRKFYEGKYTHRKDYKMELVHEDDKTPEGNKSRLGLASSTYWPKTNFLKKLESYFYEKQSIIDSKEGEVIIPSAPKTSATEFTGESKSGSDSKLDRRSVFQSSSTCNQGRHETMNTKCTKPTVKRQRSCSFDVTSANSFEKRQHFDIPSRCLHDTVAFVLQEICSDGRSKVNHDYALKLGPENTTKELPNEDGRVIRRFSNVIPEDDRTYRDSPHVRKKMSTSRSKLSDTEMKYILAKANIFCTSVETPSAGTPEVHVAVQYLIVTGRLKLTVDKITGLPEMHDQHKGVKTYLKINIMLDCRQKTKKTKKHCEKEVVEFNEDLYFDNLTLREAHLVCLRFRMCRKYPGFPRARSSLVGEAFAFLDDVDIVSREKLCLKLVTNE